MEKKKNNKKVFIIIGFVVIILVVIIIGLLCFYNNNSGDNKKLQKKDSIKSISEYINESIIVTENVMIQDDYQNKIIIPKGFKLSKESGTNLVDGIIIEDEIGNQYVWVPIGENLKNQDSNIEIELGRYIFNENGSINKDLSTTQFDEKLVKKVGNKVNYVELSKTESDANSQAIDIEEFINSSNKNGGYYIARYEASKNLSTGKANSQDNSSVWNNITQIKASQASQNIYNDNYGVTSDLVNSFAWDTAILYIQNFSNKLNGETYSKEGKFSGKGTTSKTKDLVKTGANNDEQCKINDMSGNVSEWSTETGSGLDTDFIKEADLMVAMVRGGTYYRGYKMSTDDRDIPTLATSSQPYVGFRTILYIK